MADFVVARADEPNKNNRVYPRSCLEQVVLDNVGKSIFGTLGMPTSAGTDISMVSHVAENLRLNEQGELIATIRVLNTPQGTVLGDLLKSGAAVFRTAGFSSIRMGDNEVSYVAEDFILQSINAVPTGDAA